MLISINFLSSGISFSEIALKNKKSIFVFDNNSQPSSRIAGGLYNPVVLKRFSEVWKAKDQIDFAFPFYHGIQSKLNVIFDFELPILKVLREIIFIKRYFHFSILFPKIKLFTSSSTPIRDLQKKK